VTQKLSINKSPAKDAITGELVKYRGEHLYGIIYNLIKQIWETEKMSDDWSTETFPHITYNKRERQNIT
jgi:hypothetical protein